jgi:regulator of nucleoside diphosphate kinase
MNPSLLYITRNDHHRLSLLLNAALRTGPSAALEKLRGELDRATLLDPAAIPADIVTMGSRVQIEDLGTNEVEEYLLVYPDQANIAEGRLSVLAPVGTALLGFRAGAIVDWPTPGGIRRLRLHRVTPPREVAPPAASPAVAFTAAH